MPDNLNFTAAKFPPIKSLSNGRPFFVSDNDILPFYPYYFEKNLSPGLQKYYNQNGHLLLLKGLQVEAITDIKRCQQLWLEFSPMETIFDTWEFRFAFWQGYQEMPFFLLLKNRRENLGLLPLWYEDDKKKFFWFGSWWQEENSFFVKDPLLVPLLIVLSPTPVHLNAISLETALWARKYFRFKPDDPKYILDITKVNSLDEYLTRFNKKRRYNLRRDKRIIESQSPKIIFDRFTDFDPMIDICRERFALIGEDTDWDDAGRVETFRQVIKLGQAKISYQIRMITVMIGNKIAGVDLVALYNGCYSPLKCGYDVYNFPGIGNYVNLLEIEDALKLGMKKMDFLEIGYGWKEKWFEEVPLFKYDRR